MVFTENELNNLDMIQNIELKILEEFDRICRKYNINYSVAGGSLLGAIRHSDFIPWDDDIDIDLKCDDFKRLIEILPKELPSEYEFINYNDFGEYFCDFIPRIFYKNCKVKNSFSSEDGKSNLVNDNRINGIFIELYCLHNTNRKCVKKQIFKTKIIYGLAMGHRYFKFNSDKYSFFERIAVNVLSNAGKHLKIKTIFRLYEKNCNLIKEKNSNMFFKPSVPLAVQEKNIFPKEYFSKYESHIMRNNMVSIPTDYNKILVSLYGDWKSLPPEDERKPSHFNLEYLKLL